MPRRCFVSDFLLHLITTPYLLIPFVAGCLFEQRLAMDVDEGRVLLVSRWHFRWAVSAVGWSAAKATLQPAPAVSLVR